ncbi:GDSL esterase/lipase EXL3-like [Lycium barbarum]|uniref:GDSL esterase/lipase EXL3-like n=1 Tax=Lycium barbarum TaxID=112863 RepID=UPI00293EE43A|nr:GDSL esterase/lipase EXL3-like [Lycium barbarum]
MLSPCLVFWLHNKMGLFHVLFLLFVACEGKVKNVSVKAVFTFGDSIVDQGNNNHIITFAKCNFEPYGKDFMDGNKPTGRFSNAKTPSDLIVDELGIKELMPAYLDPNLQAEDLKTGVSFASGGCGFDPQTAIIAAALPLSTQLDHFREYIGKLKELVGEEEANDILSNSLFLVVAGSDDLANTYFTIGIRRLQYDLNAYTNLIVDGASDFVQGLYKLGAKNIAVFGIPPIGCLPAQRTLAGGLTRECATEYNQAAQIANTKLSAAINWLSKTLLQSKLALIDLYNPVLDLIGNPQKHGFEVVDKGCCGTGTIEAVILCNKYSGTCEDDTKYLFWDSYHPTERGYRILVDQFLKKYIDILT